MQKVWGTEHGLQSELTDLKIGSPIVANVPSIQIWHFGDSPVLMEAILKKDLMTSVVAVDKSR
jgi:hypothetical protein